MPLRVVCSLVAAIAVLATCGCARGGRDAGSAASRQFKETALRHGEKIFARECAACHGTQGTGGPIGPSLKNERARRSYSAIRAIVSDPQPPMPKLYPSRLTANEVKDVSAYVDSL
ncbi:MAG TPA: c-type cytochrome [Candidatus Baltobacteraceae bacterium]|jgi:mono/diheme cytochrome c family protein|nr:c-type cytochrome [Candidatus Baltobacteraceae bacterium]